MSPPSHRGLCLCKVESCIWAISLRGQRREVRSIRAKKEENHFLSSCVWLYEYNMNFEITKERLLYLDLDGYYRPAAVDLFSSRKLCARVKNTPFEEQDIGSSRKATRFPCTTGYVRTCTALDMQVFLCDIRCHYCLFFSLHKAGNKAIEILHCIAWRILACTVCHPFKSHVHICMQCLSSVMSCLSLAVSPWKASLSFVTSHCIHYYAGVKPGYYLGQQGGGLARSLWCGCYSGRYGTAFLVWVRGRGWNTWKWRTLFGLLCWGWGRESFVEAC